MILFVFCIKKVINIHTSIKVLVGWMHKTSTLVLQH